MTWPSVIVNQVNQLQGETNEVERHLLFIGPAAAVVGSVNNVMHSVTAETDLDTIFGVNDSPLKQNLTAARRNAGQSWTAAVYILDGDFKSSWATAALRCQQLDSFEGIVLLPPAGPDEVGDYIEQAKNLNADLIAQFGRWQWFIIGVDVTAVELWHDDVAACVTAQNGVAAPCVQLVPRLGAWGNLPGVLAGRLCNRSVTVADSPCRVKTGAVTDLGDDARPVDSQGTTLDLAMLQLLERNRWSVPAWYPDYDGVYWADGRTLDVEGGDYQAIEYLRVVYKASRRVRLLAIAAIGDRALNSTPASINRHESQFARPLREMAKSVEINGITFPGDVYSPKKGDVKIQWLSKTKVAIYIVVRPYECPKEITVTLMLDLSINGEQS